MIWRKVNSDPPQVGQKVYYFGPHIGLWVGTYKFEPQTVHNVVLCPHILFGDGGVVDGDDAPFWMEFDEAREAKGWRPLMPKEFWSAELIESVTA
jgi:hypothetical protein